MTVYAIRTVDNIPGHEDLRIHEGRMLTATQVVDGKIGVMLQGKEIFLDPKDFKALSR